MSYTKAGPFTNGTAPGIDQTFLNGLENYLNGGVAKSGVPIMSWAGPYTATTTYTLQNHNLHDAAGANLAPDVVMLVAHSTSANSLHSAFVDETSITSTQVKIGCDNSGNMTVYLLSFKF